MDGRLWAESEVGTGTTLWLELAAATAPQLVSGPQAASAATAALPDSPELTLLYIEDNVTNLELIKGALTRLGSPTLLSAVQGRLGIDLAAQHLPDVVLLDLHLPDMHGREVLAQLKSDPRTRHIPVIVLSADATERQVRRLLDAGAYDYLTKPIEIPNFLKTIRRAAAGEGASV
jgi:CheY-like chemotaxis protein